MKALLKEQMAGKEARQYKGKWINKSFYEVKLRKSWRRKK
jgi:hypothetical protein